MSYASEALSRHLNLGRSIEVRVKMDNVDGYIDATPRVRELVQDLERAERDNEHLTNSNNNLRAELQALEESHKLALV